VKKIPATWARPDRNIGAAQRLEPKGIASGGDMWESGTSKISTTSIARSDFESKVQGSEERERGHTVIRAGGRYLRRKFPGTQARPDCNIWATQRLEPKSIARARDMKEAGTSEMRTTFIVSSDFKSIAQGSGEKECGHPVIQKSAQLMSNRSGMWASEERKWYEEPNSRRGGRACDMADHHTESRVSGTQDPPLSYWLKQNKIKVNVDILMNEEYETVQDIKDIELEDVDAVTKALGLKTKSALAFKRAHRRLLQSGSSPEAKWEAEIPQNGKLEVQNHWYLEEEKIPEAFELSNEFKDTILKLLSIEMPKNRILAVVAPVKGTKQDIVSEFIDSLIRKPKPPPEGCVKCSVRLSKGEESLPLYEYPTEEVRGRKYHTFLVLGETGSGKTTLLDAFVNCLADIDYSDSWRWKLVNEDKMCKKSWGMSMTDEISYYYISDERSRDRPFHVRIIDTPGFGDSRGMDQDKLIVQQFEKLFKTELEELDYILLVVKGTMTRWTPNARYVYDCVQQIFGKDAKDRFILMCTFANGATPNVLSVLEDKLQWEEFFKFDNSALYTPAGTIHSKKNNTKFYWNMAMQSVSDFLDWAQNEGRIPLSLMNSREVMETRAYMQASIQSAQTKMNSMVCRLETLKEVVKTIEKNRDKINRIGKVTILVDEPFYERTPLNNTYQMCTRCQVTCCQICVWEPGFDESQCTYFDGDKRCPKCPGNCPKSTHVRSKEQIIKKTRKVTRVLEEKKREKEEGQQNLSFAQRELNKVKDEMTALGKDILSCMQSVIKNMEKLEEIALKPRVFTTVEYFNQMIKHEENTKNPGWKGRVEGLKDMSKRAEGLNALNKLGERGDLRDLYPQYEKIIDKAINEAGGATKEAGGKCIVM